MAALSPYSQYRHLAVSPLALLPAVSQPCSRSRRLTVSIVTLLSARSPCCQLSHSLAVGLVALQSVSSPCCQPPRLAVSRLEIFLIALQTAPSPCSRPRHLAVGPITLQLLILSLITRHTCLHCFPEHLLNDVWFHWFLPRPNFPVVSVYDFIITYVILYSRVSKFAYFVHTEKKTRTITSVNGHNRDIAPTGFSG